MVEVGRVIVDQEGGVVGTAKTVNIIGSPE